MKIQVIIKSTSIGSILIASTAKGICAVIPAGFNEACKEFYKFFPKADIEPYDLSRNEIVNKTVAIINGSKETVPLDFAVGTAFQKKVWDVIASIPAGETSTYLEIGKKLDSKAYRAVGTACGKNPLAVLIPCHRVVGSKDIGGYRWGLEMKTKLLEREKQ